MFLSALNEEDKNLTSNKVILTMHDLRTEIRYTHNY
jgi:hypothetical protein